MEKLGLIKERISQEKQETIQELAQKENQAINFMASYFSKK